MTDAQRTRFYLPKWLAVAKALDWRMVGGRLLADLAEQFAGAAMFSPIARDLVREIITRARTLAASEQRAATADDLRHACNQVASRGRQASATKLTNSELNEFARCMAVLLQPFEDLTTAIPYLNPAEDDRRRAVDYLRKLSYEVRLRAISENAFRTRDWESLNQDRLNWLIQEVKQTGRVKRPANQPF
jgi:hypothetical protein